MKRWYIILIVVALVGSFLLGRYSAKSQKNKSTADTTSVVETLWYKSPIPISSKPLYWAEDKGISLTDSLPNNRMLLYYRVDTLSDTIKIYIPIEQKEYKGKDYHAWVSGYNAALDSIQIFPETHYIRVKEKPKKWGISFQAGYGITPKGLQPYGGLGVYYRIF